MRKLIFAINTTLDGCCDHTKFDPDEETLGFFTRLTRDAGTFLYGRKTYELMIPYWPDVAKSPSGQSKADIEFARAFDAVGQIVVFSRTLGSAAEKKTRIVRSNLKEEVVKLKQEPGKDILVGGVDLPSQLMELDLIDEYLFVIHPIVAGKGRRLFDGADLHEKLQLKFAESKILRSGCIAVQYSRNYQG
ncbi:MAG: dihydrofolate reductase [Bacteroidetes bacterium]|nr:dihydrofolate reductase [Bacteroidota bacterium]